MDFSWLIRSSADPRNTSLAIKGALVAIMPIVLYVTGIAEADFNIVVEAIVSTIFALSTIVSAVMTVYGIIRKVQFGRWSAPN